MGFIDRLINFFFNSYKKGIDEHFINITKHRDPELAKSLENTLTNITKIKEILKARTIEDDEKVKKTKPVRNKKSSPEKNAISSVKENTETIPMAEDIQIGMQKWMVRNLDVSKFRNGDPVPEAQTNAEWIRATVNKQPAWCYYKSDPRNGAEFGKLYNWYAVYDTRGLAPKGYHIPTVEEWEQLIEFSGGREYAGRTMKSKSGWENNGEGINGTNESGVTALAGGFRFDGTVFRNIGKSGNWWSSSEQSSGNAFAFTLKSNETGISKCDVSKSWGQSVRCIKDDNSKKISHGGLSTERLEADISNRFKTRFKLK